MKPAYRPDIDGLRAIAVGLVLLFHAGVPGITGGYVVVDVFFVISGYLITGILLRETADGSYSLARFYERRIRRIFPALLAVLAATTLVGFYVMTPGQMMDYGRSLVATILFVSNMYLGMTANYFAPDAESQALLHTWSLAVEEQFYIFFPLLLAVLARYRPRWIAPAVWLCAGLSFAACVALTQLRPTAAFYLAPTRAWELFAGSLLAIHAPGRSAPRLAQGLGLGGLALLAAAAFGFGHETPFPGAAAAVPVLGAVALILAGSLGGGTATQLLSSAPMRAIGLISYSLYLWHWPVIVLLRFWSIGPVTPWQMAAAMAATVLLAFLSWKYVEQPFRHAGRGAGRLRYPVLWAGAGSMAAVLAVAAGLILGQGLPARFNAQELAMLKGESEGESLSHCAPRPEIGAPKIPVCDIGASGAPKSLLVWGDSHALALRPALDGALRNLNLQGYFIGVEGCVPLLGMTRQDPPYREICAAMDDRALAFFGFKSRVTDRLSG